jgi:hypothetical protein
VEIIESRKQMHSVRRQNHYCCGNREQESDGWYWYSFAAQAGARPAKYFYNSSK